MTSSMLPGDRRWASSTRRGGMTVLGKVVVPKPINLPNQRSENHGLDPNVEIVPKGILSWGSKSSSAWGSSPLFPNTDGGASSPSHLSGRPSSGRGTRPSTASCDRAYEPTANASGPNSRPSSASGALTSNQTSLISLRPRSAETRPGSSQLLRFAEHSEHPVAWSSAGTAEKLNRSSMDYTDPPKSDSKNVGASSDRGLISMIDRKMEEHFNNLLHVMEGLNVRMCQLESRTRKIEDCVDELKDSSEFNHGRTEGKLRQLGNILTEIQGGIQDLRDKREISEVQLQLTKLQILKNKEQSQDQKTKNNTSSGQGVLSSVQQQTDQSQPSSVISPQKFPPNPNVSPITSYQSQPPIPVAGQFPAQVSQNQIPSLPQAEPNYLLPMLSSESTHQQYHMLHIQQQQPTSSAPYQPYQTFPQLPTSQLLPLPPPVDAQARYLSAHNFEEASYISPQRYNTSIQRTFNAHGLAPPNQQTYFGSNQRVYDQPSRSSEFHTEHVQPSRHSSFRDGYSHSGLPSQYSSSKMKSSELPPFSPVLASENRFTQLPTAQVLPRALPMASDVDSGSGSNGTGNRIPVDDVIDNIVAMGFRRDIVRVTVNKMTENGQSVDLNVVLDKLMKGEVQQESHRFGR